LLRLFNDENNKLPCMISMLRLLNTGCIGPLSSGNRVPAPHFFLHPVESFSNRFQSALKTPIVRGFYFTKAKLTTIKAKDYGALLYHLSQIIGQRPPEDILEATVFPPYILHLLAYYKCNSHRNGGKIAALTELVNVLTFYYAGRQYYPTPTPIVKYDKDAANTHDREMAAERAKRALLIADPRSPKRSHHTLPLFFAEWMVIEDE
jgi:hypothetical protein